MRRMKKGNLLLQLLKVTVSLGMITFLLFRISPGKLVGNLEKADPLLMAVAVAVFFLSSLLGAFQWHILLGAGGVAITFSRTFELYFAGLFFNNFFPSNVGGDAFKIYDVVKGGNDPHRVFAITLLDRIFGITGLCILAVAAYLIILPGGGAGVIGIYIAVFAACVAIAVVTAFNRRLSSAIRTLFGKIRILGLGRRFDMIFGHLGSLRNTPSLMVKVVLLTLLVQGLRIATHIFVGLGLGIAMTVSTVVHFYVFVPLLGLVMILPISINGLGVREGAGILLFKRIGILEEQAVLMEFITYAVMVAVSLLGGLMFLRRQVKSGR